MIPGKSMTPEDALLMLRRRIWLILVPFALVSAVTAVGVRFLPDLYRSETVILVVPQRIPEEYVRSTVTARIEDRLQSITQQILSRTRLERIISEFNLYASARQTSVMEDIVERMRTDITIRVVQGDTFRITYVGDNAQTVRRVVERLASLFIEENLKDRETLAEGTNQFLEAQLEDARRALVEHEGKLEQYRIKNAGELPSQLASNLQVLQSTQMQVQSLVESINRDRDRRMLAARQLADMEREVETLAVDAALPPAPVRGTADVAARGGSVLQRLAAARAEQASLEGRLQPDHPTMRRLARLVSELEMQAVAEAEARELAGAPAAPPPVSRELEARRSRAEELRGELKALDSQIAFKQGEEARLRGQAATNLQRIEMVPTRESELAELTRDYSTLQTMYETLLAKKEESRMSADLERRQVGEQFKLLDPARAAERPFSPNRPLIVLLGMAAGLGVGLVLMAFGEYRDRTFRTDVEIRDALKVPVLAVVPVLASVSERRVATVRRVALNLALSTVVLACLGVVGYSFLRWI